VIRNNSRKLVIRNNLCSISLACASRKHGAMLNDSQITSDQTDLLKLYAAIYLLNLLTLYAARYLLVRLPTMVASAYICQFSIAISHKEI